MNCSGRVDDEPGVVKRFDDDEGGGEGDIEDEDGDADGDAGVEGSVGRREEDLNLDVHFSIDVVGMIVVDCVESVGFEGTSAGGEEMEALGLLSISSKDVLRKGDGSSGMAV